jgi:hypothetical protein
LWIHVIVGVERRSGEGKIILPVIIVPTIWRVLAIHGFEGNGLRGCGCGCVEVDEVTKGEQRQKEGEFEELWFEVLGREEWRNESEVKNWLP